MKEVKVKIPTPDDVIPDEFKVHMVNAAKEILLAFKCVLDYKLKKLNEMEELVKGKNKEVKKIDIQ